MASSDFEDIRIVDLDIEESARVGAGPGQLQDVNLQLSAHPGDTWKELFRREWEGTPRDRHARVQDDHLIITCVPEELKLGHLSALREAVASANEKCRAHIEEQAEVLAQYEQQKAENAARLRAIRDELDFG